MKKVAKATRANMQGFTARKLVIVIGILGALVLVVLLVLNMRDDTVTPDAASAKGTPVTGQTAPPQEVTQKKPQQSGGSSANTLDSAGNR